MSGCKHEEVMVTGPNVGDWYTAQCENSKCQRQSRGQGHPYEALKEIANDDRPWQRVDRDRYDSVQEGEKWILMDYKALREEIVALLYGVDRDLGVTAGDLREQLLRDRVAVGVRQVHDQLEIMEGTDDVTLSPASED